MFRVVRHNCGVDPSSFQIGAHEFLILPTPARLLSHIDQPETISKLQEFTSSYYCFFVLCGVASLICEITINFGTRLPLFPEVNSYYGSIPWISGGIFPTLLYAISHFFGGVHECLNILIAVNRATAIIAPHSHAKIWRFGIPIACVVLILVGAGLSWHLFDSPSFFYPSMYDGLAYYVMVSDTSKHPGINNSRNGLITSLVSPAISVTLYTTAIFFLRKKWKLKIVRTEFSLLLLGLSSILLCLPLAFQQLYFFVKGKDISDDEALMLFEMLPWLFDLRFFSPTVLVLITDSNMRRAFLGLFPARQLAAPALIPVARTVTSSASNSWTLILYTIYVPIFTVLWIVEISLVFVHRKNFLSSYYFFFVLCGVISLICELTINFGTRLPLFPEVNSFYGTVPWISQGQFPTLLYAISHFFGAVHEFINIFTAINRATAIIAPHSHAKIWRFGIPIACVLLVLTGIGGSWYLFDSPSFFFPGPSKDGIIYGMMSDTRKHPEVSNSRNAVITSLVSPAISVSLYAAAICFLRKKWKLKIIRTEFSLMFLGLTSMLLSLPITLHQLYFYIKDKNITADEAIMLFKMLPWLFDLRFFSPTVLILIRDSNMRDKFIRLFPRRKGHVSLMLVASPQSMSSSAPHHR
ncbi:hypothetical protein PRIPAC_96693 [Pristionchus pacificus]|uniref:Serpentine receptor class gamma n=1 Tax=Pristionchus pacificus TaxID=54126 RepID=A0A2A6CUW4_PRIPA|nr:hypothetical protein PRIPAC_96693 [Pristionchus pacificus]|eukprot:PDM81811.1 G protein-coupled receptor [Pristionchus pacificus]